MKFSIVVVFDSFVVVVVAAVFVVVSSVVGSVVVFSVVSVVSKLFISVVKGSVVETETNDVVVLPEVDQPLEVVNSTVVVSIVVVSAPSSSYSGKFSVVCDFISDIVIKKRKI